MNPGGEAEGVHLITSSRCYESAHADSLYVPFCHQIQRLALATSVAKKVTDTAGSVSGVLLEPTTPGTGISSIDLPSSIDGGSSCPLSTVWWPKIPAEPGVNAHAV